MAAVWHRTVLFQMQLVISLSGLRMRSPAMESARFNGPRSSWLAGMDRTDIFIIPGRESGQVGGFVDVVYRKGVREKDPKNVIAKNQ